VGVMAAPGRMVDMLVGSVLGAGALMVFTVSGVEVVEAWDSWVKDCWEFRSVRRRAGRLFCTKRRGNRFSV